MCPPNRALRSLFAVAVLAAGFLLCGPPAVLGPGVAQAQAVTVEARRDMLFGRVATGDVPGTVTISVTDVKSTTGGVFDLGKNSRAAQFRISGPRDATVVITLPTTATLYGGGRSATLSNFTMDVTNPVTLPRNGKLNFNVGATLSLGTNLPAAEYTGTFVVFVDLQ